MEHRLRGLDGFARIFWVFAFLIFGCSPSPGVVFTPTTSLVPPTITTTAHLPESLTLPASPTPSRSTSLAPTLPASPASTPQPFLCSPLEGFSLEQLPEAIHNPFSPPRPGSDDPHQGVDFYDIDPSLGFALEGRRVLAVMSGTVSALIHDRFPYGYAIQIETPLDQLPASWTESLPIPTPATPWEQPTTLTCPNQPDQPDPSTQLNQSIYLLYAHLQGPVERQPGDLVQCGDLIGAIGNSGNSINPHLHLEVRVGPAGTRFGSMAHYDASATPEEMANYCAWRVSGIFQLIDPMSILTIRP